MTSSVITDSGVLIDSEGYLVDLNDWTPDLAVHLAHTLSLELSEEHWLLVNAIRQFYDEFDHSPAMRPYLKYLYNSGFIDQAKSIHLMRLFPGDGSPVKRIALVAGLPKPDNCL